MAAHICVILAWDKQTTATATMKTTLEISDNLFRRAKKLADREGKTFRAIIEESLVTRLEAREPAVAYTLQLPSVTGELSAEFANGGWDKIRDEVLYPPTVAVAVAAPKKPRRK